MRGPAEGNTTTQGQGVHTEIVHSVCLISFTISLEIVRLYPNMRGSIVIVSLVLLLGSHLDIIDAEKHDYRKMIMGVIQVNYLL